MFFKLRYFPSISFNLYQLKTKCKITFVQNNKDMQIKRFTFNPFQENTYILFDETNECAIVDAGCSNEEENKIVDEFISNKKLKPVLLLNTHGHIDHILGNKYISEKYNLTPNLHKEDLFLYQNSDQIANMYGIEYSKSDSKIKYLEENEEIKFGNTTLKCLLTPGHSPGSICFYNKKDGIVISGDVLFRESIGRSDLPGGDHNQLLANISEKLFTLPDETLVYPGHMGDTTISHEKINNPFF